VGSRRVQPPIAAGILVFTMAASDIVEFDDIIPTLYQNQIEAELTSDHMAWHFRLDPGRTVSVLGASGADAMYAGFTNTVFHVENAGAPPSLVTALLLPLLFTYCDRAKVPFTRLLRIRLGLYPRIMLEAAHHPHVDFYVPHQNALYYVNDADGDTVLYEETFEDVPQPALPGYLREGRFKIAKLITPKKGRMVGFDGKRYHASMHPLKATHRIAIAFSFQ
jgi:hypothetical protein